MNRLIYLQIFLFFFCLNARSQPVDNYLNGGISYSLNKTLGAKFSISDGFELPKAYANFSECRSTSLFLNYKLKRNLRLGIKYCRADFSSWELKGNDLYNNSQITQNTFFFTSQYTLFKIKNKYNLVFNFSPFAGSATTHLSVDATGYIPPGQTTADPVSNDMVFGFEASAGIDLTLGQLFGLSLDTGICKGWTSSVLFNEKGYLFSFFRIGAYYRFLRVKRLNYD
jgi:hypothetical protein